MAIDIRKLSIGIGLFAASTVFSVALAEWAVRIASPMPVFGPIFDLRPYKKIRLEYTLKGVETPGVHSANRWGMRGEDPPRDWKSWNTLIAIGGSTTQCFHLDDSRTWPARLQAKLRVAEPHTWVGNAGLDGHTTRAHLLMMDAVVAKVKPKAIVLLVGINDLCISLVDERREGGSPYDKGFAAALGGGGAKASLMGRSRLLQVGYAWKRVLAGDVTTLEQAYHKNWFPPGLGGPEDSLPPLSDFLVSLPGFRANLLGIQAKADSLGVRAVFLTQPILYGAGPPWDTLEARHLWIKKQRYRLSAATEKKLLGVFNSELLRLCAERGMQCLDLAARIPGDPAYFYDEIHFNDAGAERVADEIARFLGGTPGS